MYYETIVNDKENFKSLVGNAINTLNCEAQLILNRNIVINNENEITNEESNFINVKLDSIKLNIIGKDNVTGNLEVNIKNSQYKNIEKQKTKSFYKQIWFYFLLCSLIIALWTISLIVLKIIKKRKIRKIFNK
ncbi:hypothetical protein [Spiroplasma endosymbiont of Labia minor]|uniref:hypothetical protein n=1 Tax=Spiroplasma endosymbiont of Labia minor TaxID=3066305 RepID=UPI0030CAD23A